MRVLSGRSKLAKILITATTALVTAVAGVSIGIGVAHAATGRAYSSGPSFNAINITSDTASTGYITGAGWHTIATQSVDWLQNNQGGIDVRFSAQTHCQSGGWDGWCSIRILANGWELSPADGTNFVWQWAGNNETWGARSMERFWSGFAGTSAYIEVQVAIVGGASSFRAQDWTIATMVF
jgi:hypothetical protein